MLSISLYPSVPPLLRNESNFKILSLILFRIVCSVMCLLSQPIVFICDSMKQAGEERSRNDVCLITTKKSTPAYKNFMRITHDEKIFL